MNALAVPGRIYGSLQIDGDRWLIGDLPPHVSLRFKAMFARVSKTSARHFILRDTPETCTDLLWFIERFPLLVSIEAQRRLEAGHREASDRASYSDRVLADDWAPSPAACFREGRAPYPFQAQASALAVRLGRLLIMDDVGLGKTISALSAIADSGKLPAAIVVQAHLADQWAEDYIQAFTTMSCHIIKGTKPYPLPVADIYIFKYSNIAGWVDIAATGLFKAVVFDEIQELRRGRQSQKGDAGHVFAENATLRLGLSATPIFNYGSELFHIIELIEPGALGSYDEFILEWCSHYGSHWVVNDPAALGAYLREASLAIRRVEGDVGGQMPPVNTLLHEVAYDQSVVASIEDEARSLALKVISGSFTERGQAARDLDMMARHATGMAKAKSVAALVRMLVKAGRHVLVAGWHRDVYDVWLQELVDLQPLMFTGTESTAAKKRAKKAFTEGPPRPMFMSLRSGAGLDGLQDVCWTAVIGELDWSPQVHKQLIGRLRRPGQNEQVDAIYAHTNGGSDPVLIEMLGLKASQSSGIVDPYLGTTQVISDDSRIKKLAQSYLGVAEHA